MASTKYKAKRRILNKKRKQAKRAADIAAQNAGAQTEKVSESASATEAAPQVNKGLADQKVSAPSPSSKVRQVQF